MNKLIRGKTVRGAFDPLKENILSVDKQGIYKRNSIEYVQ